jgi:hypothetical protein
VILAQTIKGCLLKLQGEKLLKNNKMYLQKSIRHIVTRLRGLRRHESRRSQVLVSPEKRPEQRHKLQHSSKTLLKERGSIPREKVLGSCQVAQSTDIFV